MNRLESLPKHRQRILNRSTGGEFTPAAYLNIILEGNEEEWALLYQACKSDPETKEAVIRQLPLGDPLQESTLKVWAGLLGVDLKLNADVGI